MKFFESFLFMTIAAASVFFTTAFACESVDECLSTEYCNIGTGCYDPCAGTDDQLLNGRCVVRNHELMFDCFEGFQQRENAYGCERIPSKCKSDNDCFSEQLCHNGDCFDPCFQFDESVIGECTVINHKQIVTCPEGYESGPDVDTIVGCVAKGQRE